MKDSCFKNDTGRFYCDEIGMITVFRSDEKNKLHRPPCGFGNEQYMKNLVIPNGVKRIGFFDDNDYEMDVSSVTFRGDSCYRKSPFTRDADILRRMDILSMPVDGFGAYG